MIVLLSMVAIICGLICAMIIASKRNKRKYEKEAIVWFKERQLASRLYKWRDVAKGWEEERKKPVKVQFT